MSSNTQTTPKKTEGRGLAQRDKDYKATLKATGNRKAATRAYCAGNKWAMENARAVGNL